MYAIELDKKYGYVKLTFLGMITRDIWDRSLEDIYYELITNGWNKIFIDVTRGKLIMTPTELYFFVRLIKSKMLMGSCISVLARPDQMQLLNFIENIPYNRMKLRGFIDKDMAHKWLMDSKGRFRQSLGS